MKKQKLNGQILVVLLLALSILSIFVVVVATNARKDVVETFQNQQYEQSLSTAENKLLQVVTGEIELDPLEPGWDGNACDSIGTTITCEYTDPAEDESDDKITTKITISEESNFTNLPVEKDSSIKLLLNNYRGKLKIDWSIDAAWMISIDYQVGTEYRVEKDVYDNTGLFNAPIKTCFGVGPNQGIVVNGGNSITLDLATAFVGTSAPNCIPSGATLVSLRLKPLMDISGGTITNLSVTALDNNFPAQVQKVIAESKSSVSGNNIPTAIVELLDPLYESPIELFDYVLRTENEVKK